MTKQHKLKQIPIARCYLLERNPQYLTPKQLEALEASIKRDGFVAPVLARPHKDGFEIVSGNHRFMAAKKLGYKNVPAVVANLSLQDAKRLALNLNLIHGNPTAEQLAPFLADLTDDTLSQVHLDEDLLKQVVEFDEMLGSRLAELEDVDGVSQESSKAPVPKTCACPKCGKKH